MIVLWEGMVLCLMAREALFLDRVIVDPETDNSIKKY